MEESVAAAQVWRHLAALGCTRSVRRVWVDGAQQYGVEIFQGDTLIASGHHEQQGLANSAALLAAMRILGPPDRRR
ncbi:MULTISPECIES: hypothetical protein [Deinococcus]|uniref:Uncharacterized protein n=1 Tax=Deinococcus rufus TaxID=2136097 RepID=A0ABV7Z823_9DEIO|nr:hypothetical protein [Deinococcus sp. AB2017081]WQE97422.1 hypothetical protein U2P90_19465 [Deinococcus sp. AB2017081]